MSYLDLDAGQRHCCAEAGRPVFCYVMTGRVVLTANSASQYGTIVVELASGELGQIDPGVPYQIHAAEDVSVLILTEQILG